MMQLSFSLRVFGKTLKSMVLFQILDKVANVTIPPLIIGNSAFPFQPWLLKPYTNAVLTVKQKYLNY